MKRLSVSIFLLLAFAFMGLAPNLQAGQFVITASRICGGNSSGTISPSGATQVTEGEDLDVVFTPSSGYTIAYLLLNGTTPITDFAGDSRCTFDATTGTVTFHFTEVIANQTIGVCFRVATAPKLRITATVDGSGGTIATFNGTEVPGQPTIREFTEGESATYTITPTAPYSIDTIWVDGVVIDIATDPNVTDRGNATGTANVTYQFTNITADHTITVKFADNTVYHRVDVEYHYTVDGVEDPDFEGIGMVLQAISPAIGPGTVTFPAANSTWRGTWNDRVAEDFTGNYSCNFMGEMNPGITQALYLDSIFVDNVKYTGRITRGMMATFAPALSITVTQPTVIKMWMTPGWFETVRLNFVYDAKITTTPTAPVMTLSDFAFVTVDSAEAKVTHGSDFDLTYQLHDVIPATPNDIADYKIDSIYVNGALWTGGTIDAPTTTSTTITGLLTAVNADATITLYIGTHDPDDIPELTIPSLSINPNPVESKAFITKDANIIFTKIDVVDIMGNVVMTINNPGESLDIDRLNAGSYIVRFFTKDGFATRNIIKQ